MGIRAFVFDMDGTILHSLPDLVIATNKALVQMGYPTRTYDEILAFVGNGSKRLIGQACPPGTSPEKRAETFELWRQIYIASPYAHTEPFPDVVETLVELRRRNVKTAVLSNKFDAGVRVLSDRFFPGLFDIVRGEVPPTPRKPDPTALLAILNELGVQPEDAAYVGDTRVDVEVSRNAGVKAVGVSWGYDTAAPLPQDELDAYIQRPRDLLLLAE